MEGRGALAGLLVISTPFLNNGRNCAGLPLVRCVAPWCNG
jgi:hypothetical protein